MKNKLKIFAFFFTKNFLLKSYKNLILEKQNTYNHCFLQNYIKIKDLNDQLLKIKIDLKKDKDKNKIDELIDNLSDLKKLNEDELIIKIDEYYRIIYKITH